jgi:hypothetical protein
LADHTVINPPFTRSPRRKEEENQAPGVKRKRIKQQGFRGTSAWEMDCEFPGPLSKPFFNAVELIV